MADAAGARSTAGERRKQRALDAFRDELAEVDAEEIQARLDTNRIRSAERRAMARDRLRALRSKESAAAPHADGPEEPEEEPGNQDESAGDDKPGDDKPGHDKQREEQTVAEGVEPRDTRGGNGVEQPADAAAQGALAEESRAEAPPMARRIGRLVGMTAAVGGVVLAGAWLIRR